MPGIVIVTAPNADTDNLYDMLSQRSVLYDSEGNEIDNLYFSDGNRLYFPTMRSLRIWSMQ